MPWEIDTSGFQASVDALIDAVNVATRQAVSEGAALIERNAKLQFGPQHPKGTPKTVFDRPQSVTSALKRSIHILAPPAEVATGVWMARVAPTLIYGRRIELGFHGTDSLGRNYSNPGQPPYAYLKPGVERSEPLLVPLFQAAWDAATQG